ncbi:MAG: amino acid adenylation domain-containing protein [Burkholderiaceae bacterium]
MKTLIDALRRSVQHYPNRPAFCCQQEQLSYQALASRARQLSAVLIESGIKPGDRVGIFMPRCIEAPVAVYGILGAGAAFVPIDPNAPAAAIKSLVSDCGITVLITMSKMQRLLKRVSFDASPLRTVIGLESALSETVTTIPWGQILSGPDDCPAVTVAPDALAYIIHTSGSTGKPKGIMHSHASGLSYARLSQRAYQIEPEDVIGSHAPLHTDMSTLGYLTAPYAGACTALVPESYARLPASMCSMFDDHALTIWYSVPLALVQMLQTDALAKIDSAKLRWILYGGEPFSLKHLRKLSEHFQGARISNVYGPAEVNQCTHFDLPAYKAAEDWPALDDAVPIGKPWPETHALVVDASDKPVGPHTSGELLISSSTMMQGYWQQPDLNARAFFKADHQTIARTYYRTGDLVRTDEDGLLWLIGRKDRQLKVRGFRVELDHIESVLTQHPDVIEAGVFAVFDSGENTNQLVVTIIVKQADLGIDELKRFARTQLSDAATPQTFVVVDKLPRTTSGKIDRRQLKQQWQSKQENK